MQAYVPILTACGISDAVRLAVLCRGRTACFGYAIIVTREQVKIKARKWHHEYTFGPSELRISQIDAIAIGHTNISRGYKTVAISGFVAESIDR